MLYTRRVLLLATGAMLGCATPAPPVPAAPPAPEEPPFPHSAVWTGRPNVTIDAGAAIVAVPRPFTRLDVVGRDSTGLRVRCRLCPGGLEGSVPLEEVVYEPLSAAEARSASLAEFALSVARAAQSRDHGALRLLMADEFSFSFTGRQTADAALEAWRWESYSTLNRVPELLDAGLATADSALWVAPPRYLTAAGYKGLRLGFRRDAAGEWEWLFLIQGIICQADQPGSQCEARSED